MTNALKSSSVGLSVGAGARVTRRAALAGVALGALLAAVPMVQAQDGGVIKWMEIYSISSDQTAQANNEWVGKVIDQFEAENPGWTVEQESSTWDQVDQRSILDFNAGVAHDVMMSSPQLMAKHNATGDFYDMGPLIAKWSADEQNDLSWSAGYKAGQFGDKVISVPLGVHVRGNVYNRDMFTAAGIDPDRPFTTLDELVAASEKLLAHNPDVWPLSLFMGNSRATIETTYAPLVWQFGGDFYDPTTGKATVASEPSVKAVEWLYDAVHTWKITPPYSYASDADYGNLAYDIFTRGEAAQTVGFGSYWVAGLESQGMVKGCFPATPECTVGSANIMIQPGGKGEQFANSWNLSINSLSEHPEIAFKLVEVALRPENLATFPDAGLPARLSAWDKPEYRSAFWQTWLEAAKKGRSMPATPYYIELADAMAAAIQEALAGDRANIPALLTQVEADWNGKYAGK